MCNKLEEAPCGMYDYIVMAETVTSANQRPDIKPVAVKKSYKDAEMYVSEFTQTMAMMNSKLYIERIPGENFE